MFPYLIFFGAAVQLAGIYSYIRHTLRGETKPNRVTWFMWSVAPLIATAAAVSSGVGWAVLPVFMSGFAPLLAFLATFVNRRSYWKLERFDYLCGLFSVLALLLWALTRQPDVAIVFAILSDLLAAVPTIKKSWSHPASESTGPFTSGFVNALTSFGAITAWTFSAWAFPAYLVVLNAVIALVIYFRGRRI